MTFSTRYLTDRPREFYKLELPGVNGSFDIIRAYAVEISIPGNVAIHLGRFSVGLLPLINVVSDDTDVQFDAGAFCEAAKDARFVVGGNHRNESIVNFTYGAIGRPFGIFGEKSDHEAFSSFGNRTVLGDNVLISSGVTVLDGAHIGTGSVIAAGALVVGEVGEAGIYGGVPARHLRDRFTSEALEAYRALNLPMLRAHCLPLLPSVMRALASRDAPPASAFAQLEYMNRVPRLILDAEIAPNRRVKITGVKDFYIGDERIANEQSRERLGRYFAQPFSGNPVFSWTPDIFYSLGIE